MENQTLVLINEMALNVATGIETIEELYYILRQDKALMETVTLGFYELGYYEYIDKMVMLRQAELKNGLVDFVDFLERCYKKEVDIENRA